MNGNGKISTHNISRDGAENPFNGIEREHEGLVGVV